LDVTNLAELPLLAILVATAALVLRNSLRHRSVRLDLVLLAVLTVAMGFQAIRQEMWAVLTLAALAAEASRSQSGGEATAPRLLRHSLITAGVVLAGFAAALNWTQPPPGFEKALPRDAVTAAARVLAQDPSATLLGDPAVTLLLWRHPELSGRVAFDIRYEVFSETQLYSYIDFVRADAPAWQALARNYDVLLVTKEDSSRLTRSVAGSRRWTVVFSDPHGQVATSTASSGLRARRTAGHARQVSRPARGCGREISACRTASRPASRPLH
jgi:hypothetical protein